MSGLTPLLYKSLGLPAPAPGQTLPASYNELTRKADGNCDSNRDGAINKNDKNGRVEPHELYEYIYSDRGRYPVVIENLRNAGLEDPFEITPEIKKHVEDLFARYQPKTESEKAILLFRSIIPSNKFFITGTATRWFGLTDTQGGLEIPYNNDPKASLRKKHGSPLSKEILAAPPNERIALCQEYSYLLITLLRAAGIEASTGRIPRHSYVIAFLEGEKHQLDPARLLFIKTTKVSHTDRESIAYHYINESCAFGKQGKIAEALECCNTALEFDPDNIHAWVNKGRALSSLGKPGAALDAYNTAAKLEPHLIAAWRGKSRIYFQQGDILKAACCYLRSWF
ncbi:MAG: tetratricopeptide repeat protein [Candidatus Margulisiibacteriota bacterium]